MATGASPIRSPEHWRKAVSAAEPARGIAPGANVGMSGFTGAGYAKAVPGAPAYRIATETAEGRDPPDGGCDRIARPHLRSSGRRWSRSR
jgi:succinyl-CoA:acetate CoA-transferase